GHTLVRWVSILVALPTLVHGQTRRRTVGTWLLSGGEVTLRAESEGRLYVLGSSRLNVPVLSVKPDSADAWIDTTRKIIVATTAASRGEELEGRSPSLTGINGPTLVLFVKAGREGTTYELRLGSATGDLIFPKFETRAAANEFLVAMRKTAALTRLMGGTSRS